MEIAAAYLHVNALQIKGVGSKSEIQVTHAHPQWEIRSKKPSGPGLYVAVDIPSAQHTGRCAVHRHIQIFMTGRG